MKKVSLITISFLALVSLMAFQPSALAEDANVGVSVKSGEIEITKISDLNFGEITYNSSGGYYYPVIDDLSDWMVDATYPVATPPAFTGILQQPAESRSEPALVEIINNSIEYNDWKLTITRTPLMNNMSNRELKNTRLSLGNLTDTRVGFGPTVKKDYLEIGVNSAQEVFSSSGSASKGKHLISIFKSDADLEVIGKQKPTQPDWHGFKTGGPFRVKNVALYIPPNVKVEPGQYSSTLTWTAAVSL